MKTTAYYASALFPSLDLVFAAVILTTELGFFETSSLSYVQGDFHVD